MIRIGIIVGSTRPNRKGESVASWVLAAAEARRDAEFKILDLASIDLPFLDEPVPAAMSTSYTQAHTREWSETIARLDGFIFVVPEYNHSLPAPLKNALDYLYREWHDKAAGLVGYGVDGGARAIEHLRGILSELGIAHVGPQVGLSLFSDFENGTVRTSERIEKQLGRMLDKLSAWSGALSPLRIDITPENAQGHRPVIDIGKDEETEEAVQELLAELQAGLDRRDAAIYNGHFAADILWGNPVGGTVRGFDVLHPVHETLLADGVAAASRYELVQAARVSSEVIVAHVRRRLLHPASSMATEDGRNGFSEMALYVMVRRHHKWWLAAGQNTPVSE